MLDQAKKDAIIASHTTNGVIHLPKRTDANKEEYDFLRSHLYKSVGTFELGFVPTNNKTGYYVTASVVIEALKNANITATEAQVSGVTSICTSFLTKPETKDATGKLLKPATINNTSIVDLLDKEVGGSIKKVEILSVVVPHTVDAIDPITKSAKLNNVGDFVGNPDSRTEGDKLAKLKDALAKKAEADKLEKSYSNMIDKGLTAAENAMGAGEIEKGLTIFKMVEDAAVARAKRAQTR